MKLMLGALALAGTLAIAAPAAAQVALEANVARSEGRWGAELGAGYTVLAIDNFRVTPMVGVFLHDKSHDRYDLAEIDGRVRCRNVVTDRPVDRDRCDSKGRKVYGRVEATLAVPVVGIEAGAGARLTGGDFRPYVTASAPLLPMVDLKANAGSKYLAAGLSARF